VLTSTRLATAIGAVGLRPTAQRAYIGVMTPSEPPPTRVMVVDDDPVIRQLIAMNLELEGYEVHAAADGAEALEVAQSVHPAVATIDVMMPVMDGLEAAAALRADPRTSSVRVCLVTARAQAADRQRAATAPGVDAYLAKPFDPAELLAVVARLVSG
jgi:CheY-like chemotaxis protein